MTSFIYKKQIIKRNLLLQTEKAYYRESKPGFGATNGVPNNVETNRLF
jgi:hypothetical protein